MVIKFIQQGISIIKITIDGSKKIHDSRRKLHSGKGTFDQILENINIVQDLPLSVVIRVNIDKSTKEAYADVLGVFNNFKNVTVYLAIVTFESIQGTPQKTRCYSHKEYNE